MKKIIILAFILFLLPMRLMAVTWDDCPFGEENEAYPGACGRYIDTDKDGICDHSQPAPAERAEDEGAKLALGADNDKINLTKEPTAQTVLRYRYNFIPLTIVLLSMYLATYVLARRKIISLLTQRRLWNTLLLLAFLIVGLLGLLLVIRINFGWDAPLPFNMLYWHVEAGIVMAVISIFHIAWHWRFFTSIVKRK